MYFSAFEYKTDLDDNVARYPMKGIALDAMALILNYSYIFNARYAGAIWLNSRFYGLLHNSAASIEDGYIVYGINTA